MRADWSLDDLLLRADEVRAFPDVALRIVRAAQGERATNRALARAIACDTAVSARLLRVANSPFYGLSRKVESIEQAISVLGIYTARDLALSVALATASARRSPIHARLWRHATRVAAATAAIAGAALPRQATQAYTLGLIHDIGHQVFLELFPDEAASLWNRPGGSATAEERAAFGWAHTDIGAACADRWRLPGWIGECLALHHSPPPPPDASIRPRPSTVLLAALLVADGLEHEGALDDEERVRELVEAHPATPALRLRPGATERIARAVVDAVSGVSALAP